MKLSLKNMLISFVAALLVFSVVMTAICIGIYRSKIGERTVDMEGEVSHTLPTRQCRYDFFDTYLYWNSSRDFQYAVFVGVIEEERLIVYTPISPDLPVQYKNGIYFVSSIVEAEGTEELSDILVALTGIAADNYVNGDFLSYNPGNTADEYVASLVAPTNASWEGYNTMRIDIILDGNGVADNHKTMEQFFIIESK